MSKRANPDNTIATYQKKVVRRMISLYCRARHGMSEGLCPECGELARYADERLDACPFRQYKPNCSSCRVHCYTPQYRQRMRTVMRFSGPRMPLYMPGDFLVYFWRKIRYK